MGKHLKGDSDRFYGDGKGTGYKNPPGRKWDKGERVARGARAPRVSRPSAHILAEHFEKLLASPLGEGTVGEAWVKSLLGKAMADPKIGMRLFEALSRVSPDSSSNADGEADDLGQDEQLILDAKLRKIADLDVEAGEDE